MPMPGTPILMYHSVAPRASGRFHRFTVPPEVFAEQLAYLAAHSYTPLTIGRWQQLSADDRAAAPTNPVLLTFDDGFADFHEHALPLLTRFQFGATLYITSGFIGGTSRWLAREGMADYPMLGWRQLAEVRDAGIECGGHSHTHPSLDALPAARAADEIARCKRILEDGLGVAVDSFAYPFGFYDARARRLVAATGYTSACAVGYRLSSPTSDPLALPRVLVGPDTHGAVLGAMLAGRSVQGASRHERIRSHGWRFFRRALARTRRGAGD